MVKALAEAEAHRGPSLVIAYAPCAMHGISSMGDSQVGVGVRSVCACFTEDNACNVQAARCG